MNRGNVVYDPNDLARTTIKETNIHNYHSGNLGKNAPSRGVVYDPSNVPKRTTKETTITNNVSGSVTTLIGGQMLGSSTSINGFTILFQSR
jgi:hypothetical protein